MDKAEQYIQEIQENLSDDLLKSDDYNDDHPLSGHCYVASEALYHLLGGEDSKWFPVRARDQEDTVHWWLEDKQGNRLDPTKGQYSIKEFDPPYEDGTRGPFLTKQPSKRTQKLLNRLNL